LLKIVIEEVGVAGSNSACSMCSYGFGIDATADDRLPYRVGRAPRGLQQDVDGFGGRRSAHLARGLAHGGRCVCMLTPADAVCGESSANRLCRWRLLRGVRGLSRDCLVRRFRFGSCAVPAPLT
jgi:hypothetical protein